MVKMQIMIADWYFTASQGCCHPNLTCHPYQQGYQSHGRHAGDGWINCAVAASRKYGRRSQRVDPALKRSIFVLVFAECRIEALQPMNIALRSCRESYLPKARYNGLVKVCRLDDQDHQIGRRSSNAGGK